MKIKNIQTKKVELELTKPFVTAALKRTSQSTVLVKIETDDGIIGYGESVPARHINGESPQSIELIIHEIARHIKGLNPLDLELIHHIMDTFIIANHGAKAGIDIALHDIKAKIMNQPLYRMLGGFCNQIQTDITLSIDEKEKVLESALKYVHDGFKILKIKIGRNPKEDIQTLKMIREAVGSDIVLKADANQGYNMSQALYVLNELLRYDIQGIEQPVAYWDIEGMAEIKTKSAMNLIADEGVKDHYDAMKFIKAKACDMINIKLMKSCGLFKAEKINAVCESTGLNCMIGCMIESNVGISAAAHFAASKANITAADLDSFILTKELPFIKGGFTVKNDIITLSDEAGLGLDIDF